MYKTFQKILFVPFIKIKAKRLGKELLDTFTNSDVQILDLGCGDMIITEELSQKAPWANITGVDVINTSLTEKMPILYDGNKIPFEDNYFDFSYTSFTLHHCENPEMVLRELLRVTKGKVAIIEEIYSNPIEKYITYAHDYFFNRLESLVVNIPFNFKTDKEWKQIFKDLGCELVGEKRVYQVPVWFTKQKMYVVQSTRGGIDQK